MRHTDNKIVRRPDINFGGLCAGLVFFCLSLTPSLLPRGYVAQGVASGLSIVTGYCLGVLGSILYRKLPLQRRETLHAARHGIIVVLLAAAVVFVIAGMQWQQAVREATDAPPISAMHPLLMIVIAVVVAALLILAGRGCRRLGRYFGRLLGRRLPPKVAVYGGGLLAALLLIFIVNGVLINAVFGFINYSFGLANKGTPEGVYQPQASIFSGSPSSKIDWNTLGEKGREFVAGAPQAAAIAAFAGQESVQPSRLYAGLESAPALKDRVGLLIAELDRTSARDRKAVLIAIPTGSGGINPKAVQSVEYIYGGSTATLGIQYSYLPSWLSFLADQETARENGRVLTEAVYDWWHHLDPAKRPQLLMYGESLGTLGADGAFSGAADMQNRMHAVLLAGPPHANELWSAMVAGRDEGTRAVLPTYQHGEAVRFSDGQTAFDSNPPHAAWDTGRVAILQHPSDPVVWAALEVFVHKPDWLKEPSGYDVLPNMRWYPFVTGWQVALDLPFAFSATPGHGHRYDNNIAGSWLAVLKPGLTAQKSSELENIINSNPH